ncbi:MAG: rubrerythrin family protein [Chloroflexi bacterium]|nr:rubrerythrin family protein [Chloroflexota bacterium]
MSHTEQNLDAAFAGESQANRRYLFFAEQADQEGLKQIARQFRAAAEAETVHARNHFKVRGGVKTTAANLQAAIDGEYYEFSKMYPGFLKQAEAEGQAGASDSFDLANRVEQVHHKLFRDALYSLEKGQALELKPFHVCQRCGNTVEGEPPAKCPVCGATRASFKPVE